MQKTSEKAKSHLSGAIRLIACKEDPLPARVGTLGDTWTLILTTAPARITHNGNEVGLIRRDSLTIMLPDYGHKLERKNPSTPFGFTAIKIEGQVPDPLFTVLRRPPTTWHEQGFARIQSQSIKQLFALFASELTSEDGIKPMTRELFLMLLGSELGRLTEGLDRAHIRHGLSKSILQAVLDHMEENLSSSNSVPDLAKMANCTPDHFIRLFRKATNTTPHQHLIERRLQRAAIMLASGQKASSVSESLGFYDASAFTRAFKTRFGVPPSQYALEAVDR
jgi:AraC-like DNA-binding protein